MDRRTPRAVVAALVSVIALTGCSGDGDDRPGKAGSPGPTTSSSAARPAAPRATIGTLTGRLSPDRRQALAEDVADVVDRWLDGAYLGDFPRADYSAAFAGFTPGAAAKARRNLPLMTNAGISDRIDEAEETRRSISLDVLALKQRAVGVTARVDVAFRTTGTLAGDQQVTGTLDLTPTGNGWKVFGFEISRRQA